MRECDTRGVDYKCAETAVVYTVVHIRIVLHTVEDFKTIVSVYMFACVCVQYISDFIFHFSKNEKHARRGRERNKKQNMKDKREKRKERLLKRIVVD